MKTLGYINKNEDKLKGVFFGQAIGDALGLGTEFMTKAEIRRHYPHGLNDYSQIIQDYHRSRWEKGSWTDDTDMMLCIAESIVKNKEVNLADIAQNFKQWFLQNPMGIGRHTYKLLCTGLEHVGQEKRIERCGHAHFYSRIAERGCRETCCCHLPAHSC